MCQKSTRAGFPEKGATMVIIIASVIPLFKWVDLVYFHISSDNQISVWSTWANLSYFDEKAKATGSHNKVLWVKLTNCQQVFCLPASAYPLISD